MNVELIYDADCPNAAAARALLGDAFAATGIPARWKEWERGSPESPGYAREYGSPTILVNGRDIAPATQVSGAGACRVYADTAGRLSGVPTAQEVQAALRGSSVATPFTRTLPTLPAVGIALLPKLTCAACWPAYAGLLSALGIGFIDYTPYLLPLTAVFLLLTLGMLAWRARSRRGYRPFVLGALAAAIVLVGKFGLDSDLALYGGITLLVGASLWNAWPKRAASACAACITVPQAPAVSAPLSTGQR